jgi:hypothetical protein
VEKIYFSSRNLHFCKVRFYWTCLGQSEFYHPVPRALTRLPCSLCQLRMRCILVQDRRVEHTSGEFLPRVDRRGSSQAVGHFGCYCCVNARVCSSGWYVGLVGIYFQCKLVESSSYGNTGFGGLCSIHCWHTCNDILQSSRILERNHKTSLRRILGIRHGTTRCLCGMHDALVRKYLAPKTIPACIAR